MSKSLFYSIILFVLAVSMHSAQAQITDGQTAQNTSCERTVQAALPRLQTVLAQNNYAQIESILTTIEDACGRTEFTQRIRIVSLMIQQQNSDEQIHYYLSNYLDHRLIERLESSADQDFANIYNADKPTFDYVPLRNPVDSLIIQKSAALLGSDLYQLNDAEETLAFLFSDHINTYLTRMKQEAPGARVSSGGTPRPSDRVQRQYKSEFGKERVGVVLSGGLYTPANAVNPIFRRGGVFGLSVISPLSRDWVFDGFLKYRSNNSREFEYILYNEVEWVESRYSIMLGGSVGYKFLDLGRFLMLGKGSIAFEAADTGLSETYIDDWGYSSSTPHTVNTYNLSFGVAGWQHLAGRTFGGLQVQYHHSPYNNYRNLITPIASGYVSVELMFRF